jgi:hypothetical protein
MGPSPNTRRQLSASARSAPALRSRRLSSAVSETCCRRASPLTSILNVSSPTRLSSRIVRRSHFSPPLVVCRSAISPSIPAIVAPSRQSDARDGIFAAPRLPRLRVRYSVIPACEECRRTLARLSYGRATCLSLGDSRRPQTHENEGLQPSGLPALPTSSNPRTGVSRGWGFALPPMPGRTAIAIVRKATATPTQKEST